MSRALRGVSMPRLIQSPTIIPAAGNKPKVIREYIGRVNTKHPQVSIAAMESPEGWVEPGQRPEFYEFTVVQSGTLRVEDEHGQVIDVSSGQAVITEPGEWVRYSSPHAGGATYMAICLPAFSPDMVHRDTQ